MIDRAHPLPISRQVKLVGISRSSAYYVPSPVSVADLSLMRRIDELHLEDPFAGARMLMRLLKREGVVVGRKHVGPLMRKMGIDLAHAGIAKSFGAAGSLAVLMLWLYFSAAVFLLGVEVTAAVRGKKSERVGGEARAEHPASTHPH